MSAVFLSLLVATVVVAVGFLVSMFRRDEPLLGGIGVCLLVGPGSLLAFVHVGVAQFERCGFAGAWEIGASCCCLPLGAGAPIPHAVVSLPQSCSHLIE